MSDAESAKTCLYHREQGSGPLALFVHGFPLDSTMWLDQLSGLADLRRCVAIDLRGFGFSEATTLPALTVERLADDLAATIVSLGKTQADVVALSMGGYVALALAERHPEVIRSLALVDTQAGADDEAGRAGRRAAAVGVVTDGRAAFAEKMMAALLGPDAGPFVQARLRSMIEGCRYETIVASLEGMRLRPDRSAVLPGISVPTAVIVGEDDKVTPPAAAEAMACALPDATLHILAGAGHMTPIEQPEAVSDALRALFLRVDAC